MGSSDPRENLTFSDISTVSAISPEDFHRQATLARAFENSWRLREAYIFLALKESRIHNQLGSSSVEQYALLRKLKLRDGGVCQNPFCRRTVALQGAHIERRSEGGPTTLANEVQLCVWCHAIEDQGLLEIRGNPVSGLEFITPADRMNGGLREELRALAAVPFVTVSVRAGRTQDSAWGSDAGLERLAGGLERLGHGKRESRDALREAREELLEKGTALTPESLLQTAIQILHPRHPEPHPSNGDGPGPAAAPG